jgi:hypothetical protein
VNPVPVYLAFSLFLWPTQKHTQTHAFYVSLVLHLLILSLSLSFFHHPFVSLKCRVSPVPARRPPLHDRAHILWVLWVSEAHEI